MESLNFELPQDIRFDKYAQQILENSKTSAASSFVSTAAAPTITSLNANTSSELLQKLGASLLNSVQLQRFLKIDNTASVGVDNNRLIMEPEFAPNHVVIDSSSFDVMDEFQKQLEYDKFMNEVWIGIVMTLILISMLFCVCSCFLYHQFRTWKRNYRTTTAAQAHSQDNEALKLHSDIEDPVPEYTLVSGLPSYEAALELLHKTPKSCLIVYPNVFEIFNKNEKSNNKTIAAEQQQQQAATLTDVTTPLLSTTSTATSTIPNATFPPIPTYAEAIGVSNVTVTCINEKPTVQAKKSPTISPRTTTTTAIASTTATPNTTNYAKSPSYEQSSKSLEKQ